MNNLTYKNKKELNNILVGKKIVSISLLSHNTWTLDLNDGSKVSLSSDQNPLPVCPGLGDIPGLMLQIKNNKGN